MSKLIWDAPGERFFEAGVDCGVLYPPVGAGVAWNGLTAVNETPAGGEARPYYIDGRKYMNAAAPEDFAATLEAYYYPEEFEQFDGYGGNGDGLIFAQQTRKSFGLSYRTRLGNDLDGINHGYRIHLVYNALANPSPRNNATITATTDLKTFSWSLTTIPVSVQGRNPTAHLIIDSTRTHPALLLYLEEFLYGSKNNDPTLLVPSQIVNLYANPPSLLKIMPHEDTGLADLIESNRGDLIGDRHTGLYRAPSISRLIEIAPGLNALED